MNAPTIPLYITVNECAALISAHPMTIRKWIDKGKIPACRIGRAVRIDREALLAGFEAQKAILDKRGRR